MSPDSPEEAARKAAERAARMAKFSSQAIDEEDEPVAVRSFNQAREGADAGKVYSPKTGRVEDGTVSALPRKAGRGPSTIDDDDLLAEIDAAVDAAASDQPKLPDLNTDEDDDLLAEIDAAVNDAKRAPAQAAPAPPGMNARRLAAMAAAAGDKSPVDAPAPEGLSGAARPNLPKGLAAFASGDDHAVFTAERRAKPKGPTNLSEDDLTGLRPSNGVKPTHAVVPNPDEDTGDEPAVVSGRGRGPAPRHSAQDDDDLLAEIDAAVEAAEQEGVQEGEANDLKSADDSWEDVAEGERKKGQPAYSGPNITSPGDAGGFEAKTDKRAPTPGHTVISDRDTELTVRSDKPKAAPMAISGEEKFNVKSDKPRAADPLAFAPGSFTAKLDKEHRDAPKIANPADAMKFEAVQDREERDAIKIRNPTDSESFEVSKDQSSDELAKNAEEATPAPAPSIKFGKEAHKSVPAIKSPGDTAFAAKRDATPKPLPKMHSPGDEKVDARQDAERKPLPKMHSAGDDAVNARQDKGHSSGPAFKGLGESKVETKLDRETRQAPKIHSPGESRPDVKLDRETRQAPKISGLAHTDVEARMDRTQNKGAPKILSPADAERYAVNLDRAARATPMPKMANPSESGFETKQDAQRKEFHIRADEQAFEAKRDAQSKTPPKLRNPTEAEAFEHKQDAQSKAPPKLRNPTEAGAFEHKQDAQRKALPKMHSAADVDSFEAKQDAQRKALPHMRSAADVDSYEARMDKEARGGIPQMRSAADAEAYETKQDAQRKALPSMHNAADVDQYAVKRDAEAKPLPQMRSSGDVDAVDSKLDREKREKVDVFNPGQTEFDVKYEHESVWTTKPKRDVEQSGDGKREKKGK